jgi:hypothetical protein
MTEYESNLLKLSKEDDILYTYLIPHLLIYPEGYSVDPKTKKTMLNSDIAAELLKELINNSRHMAMPRDTGWVLWQRKTIDKPFTKIK